MKTKILMLTAVVLLSIIACQKVGPIVLKSSENKFAKPMLMSITWPTLGAKAELAYNPDSTVSRITYTSPGLPSVTQIEYGSFGMTKNSNSTSLALQEYEYDGMGKVVSMSKRIKEGTTSREVARFDFTYGSKGQLTVMDYSLVNVQGKSLESKSLFEYDINGLPTKITSIQKDNSKMVITIDKYSDEFDFDPAYFFERDMGSFYQIYNYASLRSLSKLRKLPARITLTNETSGQAVFVKRVEIDFVISGGKIRSQASTTTENPATPVFSEVNYTY